MDAYMTNGIHKEKKVIPQNPCCCKCKDQGNTCSREVTDKKVHDNKMLKKLVNHVLKINPLPPHKTNLRSVLAYGGAHDTNRNFT
jgi:hypothetical protein